MLCGVDIIIVVHVRDYEMYFTKFVLTGNYNSGDKCINVYAWLKLMLQQVGVQM